MRSRISVQRTVGPQGAGVRTQSSAIDASCGGIYRWQCDAGHSERPPCARSHARDDQPPAAVGADGLPSMPSPASRRDPINELGAERRTVLVGGRLVAELLVGIQTRGDARWSAIGQIRFANPRARSMISNRTPRPAGTSRLPPRSWQDDAHHSSSTVRVGGQAGVAPVPRRVTHAPGPMSIPPPRPPDGAIRPHRTAPAVAPRRLRASATPHADPPHATGSAPPGLQTPPTSPPPRADVQSRSREPSSATPPLAPASS
jgi:hypothetical protein